MRADLVLTRSDGEKREQMMLQLVNRVKYARQRT